jgi:hypothetical protein
MHCRTQCVQGLPTCAAEGARGVWWRLPPTERHGALLDRARRDASPAAPLSHVILPALRPHTHTRHAVAQRAVRIPRDATRHHTRPTLTSHRPPLMASCGRSAQRSPHSSRGCAGCSRTRRHGQWTTQICHRLSRYSSRSASRRSSMPRAPKCTGSAIRDVTPPLPFSVAPLSPHHTPPQATPHAATPHMPPTHTSSAEICTTCEQVRSGARAHDV